MSPPIAIFGALARFNYGDLLFPIIVERALRDAGWDGVVQAVGIRRSDLSRYGAMPTQAAGWLTHATNLPDGSKIIIAGGETLAAGWGRLFSHLLPAPFGDSLYRSASRILGEARLDRFGQRRARVPWAVPFCPRPRYFTNRVGILFNSVGGSGLAGRDAQWRAEVEAAIGEAEFASVRDRVTYEALGGDGASVELHPDSAAVAADFFPPEWLRERARPDLRTLFEGEPYICFQLHRYFATDKLRRFAAALDRCQREAGLRIVLLPIGRATGHSDQVALKRVRSFMKGPATLPTRLGIFDIMALLAHSAAYAGTSLHGLITAMSFGRPYALLGKNPKCLAFADEWARPEYRAGVPAKNLFEELSARVTADPQVMASEAASLRAAAHAGLARLTAAALDSH